MSLDGKWAEGLQPDMSLADAAREILTRRFDALITRWKDANDKPNDSDAIHDLRVASRRSAAALDAFGDRLPRGRCRQLRRQLRRIRQAAGRVRDRDVFLQQLTNWMKDRDAADLPGLDYLCGIWRHKRQSLCEDLQPRLSGHEQFADRVESLPVRGGHKSTLAERALEFAPELLDEFARAITSGHKDPESLHAIRIAGKHLRYGLELFCVCVAPGQLEPPYDLIEELQDVLGEAHDAEVNAQRVKRELDTLTESGQEAAARYRLGIQNWLIQLQSIEVAGPAKFGDWLSRWEGVDTKFEFLAQKSDPGPAN